MKRLITILALLFATISSGQTISNDTIEVVYDDVHTYDNATANFVDGQFLGNSIYLNHKKIENVNIINEKVTINSIDYSGQIHIKMKQDYNLQLITLAALKNKYINHQGKSVMFMIDGKLIDEDYDTYLVDKNYILKIKVEKIENAKEKLNFLLIKLLTKSDENIKKAEEIRIR